MKLPKRFYLGAAAFVFAAGIVTTVALLPDSKPKEVNIKQTSAKVEEAKTQGDSTEVATTETQPAETPKPPTPTPVPTPAPAPAAPLFGEIAPGSYEVFDKNAVMAAAGIPEADRPIVDRIVTTLSGWRYKEATQNNIMLCNIYGAGYLPFPQGVRDDPIVQLKWCHKYVTEYKYGSWAQAEANYSTSSPNF